MNRIPVIFDTDIGDDIDDTWALAMLLKCPELDIKLITATAGDTTFRAKLISKFLEGAGRTDIPVGIGVYEPDEPVTCKRQKAWVGDYELAHYPGIIYEDGVQAIIDCVQASSEPVSLISIGPLTNISAVIDRAPEIVPTVNYYGMQGSFFQHHTTNLHLAMVSEATPEWNVVCNIPASQKVFSAPWNSVTITPVDTCAQVVLDGTLYAQCVSNNDPIMRMVIENYRMWSPKNEDSNPEVHSSVLFDTVAVYLAFSNKFLEIKQMMISINNEGFTIEDAQGMPVDVALNWKDLDLFKTWLVKRLLS